LKHAKSTGADLDSGSDSGSDSDSDSDFAPDFEDPVLLLRGELSRRTGVPKGLDVSVLEEAIEKEGGNIEMAAKYVVHKLNVLSGTTPV
jgi:hypothetical protein